MRRWLARLSFSFLILAMVLAWTGYKASKLPDRGTDVLLCYAGAGVCLALFLAGTRERHREDDV
jgi:hypothetical protein